MIRRIIKLFYFYLCIFIHIKLANKLEGELEEWDSSLSAQSKLKAKKAMKKTKGVLIAKTALSAKSARKVSYLRPIKGVEKDTLSLRVLY